MPTNPTKEYIPKSVAEIVRTATKLKSKLAFIQKYSLLGPLLNLQPLGTITMFHTGRSGSTILGTLLDQHPQIFWGHELYYPVFKPYHRQWKPGTTIQIDHRALLRQLARWAGRRYFGFEIKFHHLDRTAITLADYVDVLREFGVNHFIILERKNYLRRMASSRIGSAHGRMEVKKSEETSLLKVEIPLKRVRAQGEITLLEMLQLQQKQFAELRNLLKDDIVLELDSAQDIFPNPVNGYQKVCEFIGLEAVPVEVATRRANPFPLQDTISNFAEVERALQNTPFEWMLYSDD